MKVQILEVWLIEPFDLFWQQLSTIRFLAVVATMRVMSHKYCQGCNQTLAAPKCHSCHTLLSCYSQTVISVASVLSFIFAEVLTSAVIIGLPLLLKKRYAHFIATSPPTDGTLVYIQLLNGGDNVEIYIDGISFGQADSLKEGIMLLYLTSAVQGGKNNGQNCRPKML